MKAASAISADAWWTPRPSGLACGEQWLCALPKISFLFKHKHTIQARPLWCAQFFPCRPGKTGRKYVLGRVAPEKTGAAANKQGYEKSGAGSQSGNFYRDVGDNLKTDLNLDGEVP